RSSACAAAPASASNRRGISRITACKRARCPRASIVDGIGTQAGPTRRARSRRRARGRRRLTLGARGHYARRMLRAASLLTCLVPLLAAWGHAGGNSSASSSTSGTGGAATTSTTSTAGTGGTPAVPTVPYVYVGADDDTISAFLLDRATGTLTPKGS